MFHRIKPAVDRDEALLMIGKTLGNYQISSQFGKGGMGEIYQPTAYTSFVFYQREISN
jgi:hypothetical protein